MTAKELKEANKVDTGLDPEQPGHEPLLLGYYFDVEGFQEFCEQLLLEYDQSQFDDPSLAEDDFYADGRDHFITELFKP